MVRIKELNWHKASNGCIAAITTIGTYEILQTPSGHFIPCFDDDIIDSIEVAANNLNAAKARVWSHHVAIVSQLIEVDLL